MPYVGVEWISKVFRGMTIELENLHNHHSYPSIEIGAPHVLPQQIFYQKFTYTQSFEESVILSFLCATVMHLRVS